MGNRVGVIGAGSWGTTLAAVLTKKGYPIILWGRNSQQVDEINREKTNQRYLPDIKLPAALRATTDLAEAVHSDYLVLAVPSHAMRNTCQQIKPLISDRQLFVNVAKGIENDTLLRMSEVISHTLEIPLQRVATLSGPSHAEEVIREIATAVVSASTHLETARKVRELFRTDYFRVYSSTDLKGVELGGSLKNVIAIAAGISDGVGFGDNTKAALLTRGAFEIARLGQRLGARPETFSGLSGIGDLIVTCMSRHSRNRFVGEQIGKGKTLEEVLREMVMVAEGVKTTRSVHQLQKKYNVEMPISEQVYQVLFNQKDPREAVYQLMTRDPKEEM